jgi:hypothetical protein
MAGLVSFHDIVKQPNKLRPEGPVFLSKIYIAWESLIGLSCEYFQQAGMKGARS